MKRTLSSLLVAASIGFSGTAMAAGLDFGAMTDAERAEFRAEVRAYLLANPEVIFEAIQILEERRDMASVDADREMVRSNTDELFRDGFSYSGGNPDGDVTIVEFLDYRCGYCKRAHPEIAELLDRDPNVRLVVKEFPILGPDSVLAGKLALAAMAIDPARYKALNDAMMYFEGNLTERAAYQIAGDLGYDVAALRERARSVEIDDKLNRNYQLAQSLGLQGTPAFVVGDQIIRGYLPVDEMLAVVDEARAASN